MTTGEKIRKFYREHSTGVLGTVIFHLLLLIFLLSVGISRIKERYEIELELAVPPPAILEKVQEEKEQLRQKTSSEEVERMLRSIAVNENARENKSRDARVQEYIDEVTKELESGSAAGRYAARTDKNYRKDSLQHDRDKKEQLLDSLKSTFYSGESSVSYNLKERYARILPIPVFKCEFGGKVVVVIQVDRKGRVQKAAAVPEESSRDECLLEVAVDAALRSVFNEKPGAPPLQSGTITYNFVKQ